MTESQRIVVTGVGVVSAFGWGVNDLRRGLRSGHTGVQRTRKLETSGHRTRIAGEVPATPPRIRGTYPEWERLSRADRFAVAAAGEAIRQCGFESLPSDSGVFFGTSTAGMLECEDYVTRVLGVGAGVARTLQLASQQLNGPGDAVARSLGVTGPVQSISSACASSSLAIRAGASALGSREVQVAIVGGSDSLCQLTYGGFNSLRAVDPEPSKPFQVGRAGLNLGEGAGVLVLERLEDALSRGAQPLAQLRGCGASCDAHHMTAPEPNGTGALSAISDAMKEASCRPEDLAFVNAHGTGTPHNDSAEARAFSALLGRRSSEIPVTVTKAAVGHLLGAAGAIEAVATILVLVDCELHPTPEGGVADPDLGVQLPCKGKLDLPGGAIALSVNLGFGGANAALVFQGWRDD